MWIELDVNIVSALALFVSVIAVFISIYTDSRNRKLNRPAIILKDETEFKDGVVYAKYYLSIVNIGHIAAVNVVIPDNYIQKYSCFSEWYSIRRELLPDGGKTVCAGGDYRFFESVTDVEIYYEDYAGNKYSTIYKNGRFTFGRRKK